MPPPGMHAHQLPLPFVSNGFTVAVLRLLRSVNVVADLVKEHPAEKAGPNQLQLERPSRDVVEGPIDEHFDPGRLRARRMMVESGRAPRVSELLATIPTP